MRAIRAAASAALLAPMALVVLAAPAALAEGDDGPGLGPVGGLPENGGFPENSGFPKNDGGSGHGITSFGFSVTPRTVAPGGTVTLKSDGCEVPTVTVTSGIFDTVTLNEGHEGTATVDFDAKAGTQYEITFDCKGERGTTTLTIAADGHQDGGHQDGGHQDGGHQDGGATGAHKGVKAGFGSAGVGTTEMVTGGVLIAGALGAAVVLARRRENTGS
ncbi:hypothetical protein [Streptomyces sp. NPDC004267]|uniref:hypothetical protein n=1 Tax=Streptomyces sp. NPDC004267 TaxID=3364694 RepID=UPI00368B7054